MPAPEHRGRKIEAEVVARATPEQAWEAWADPRKLAGWFVDRARGEGRTGETMTWVFERFGVEVRYRVVESVPGERIVFGPASDDFPPFVLEIVLSRHHGETKIRLVNSGFSEDAGFDEQFGGTDSGWRMALGALTEYLERHFGEARKVALALRPASYDANELRRVHTSPSGLACWLGHGSLEGGPGTAVRLELIDGGTLTGRILADTGPELSVSWEEIGGVLELKAFVWNGTRQVGVRAWGWGMDEEETDALEARLEPMAERLAGALAAARSS